MIMALQLLILLFTTLSTNALPNPSNNTNVTYPFTCSQTPTSECVAYLYHISNGLTTDKIASYYSVQPSQIRPIRHGSKQDYLVSVPCGCTNDNGMVGYFYKTIYTIQSGDTFGNINNHIYSGQVWQGDEQDHLNSRDPIPMHLLCGCLGGHSQVVVTYTVQDHDTLSGIAIQLSSSLSAIQSLNVNLTADPNFIVAGWVLFVPAQMSTLQSIHYQGKKNMTPVIVGATVSAALLIIAAVGVFLYRSRRSRLIKAKDPKSVSKTSSAKSMASLQNQYMKGQDMEDAMGFDPERPMIFSLEEIEEATANFDEARKIGEGGYGSVYFGILREQVELIGYASGDDHLYLVYEFVQNGSLSELLHGPLLKGHQPLSWNARVQIALDAARGIEYIHDHTKARYVHRDIKSSNILLDQGLKAKVADFGLAKLVVRSVDEECIATCLVGTPGYLPPESVRDLQMTSKSDVFAFGVVLAELISGQRALIRDNSQPNKMKSLISIVYQIFRGGEQEKAVAEFIDENLKGNYPIEEVYKMLEISAWCLSEDPVNRPEMSEIVVQLSQILMASVEWESSLGGNNQIFSGIFSGR